MSKLSLSLTLLFVFGALLFVITPSSYAQDSGAVPRIENADCAFELPETDATVDCAYVTVPRNRSNPDNGEIRLHVGVFRSTGDSPAPDPVIYLDGGPGGQTLATLPYQYEDLVAPHLPYRDVVVFDQRGIGYSEPNLDCPAALEDSYDLLDEVLTPTEESERYIEVYTDCLADLEGLDLRDFNSTENAADVNDILRLLGYEEWNLYGISYGTMLAQYVVRDFPDPVRSVVLDANVPFGLDLYELIPPSFDRALQELYAACEMDALCSSTYPDLQGTLTALYEDLNAEPITITTLDALSMQTYDVAVTGDVLLSTLYGALYSRNLVPLLPRAIFELSEGETGTMSQLLAVTVTNLPFATPVMYASIMCQDEVGTNSFSDYENAISALDPMLQSYFAADAPSVFEACQLVTGYETGQAPTPTIQSDIPALITSGQFDPITPPAFGDEMANYFSNATVLTFPASGHGASVAEACGLGITVAFLNDPTAPVDSACIEEMPPISFSVPITAIELENRELASLGVRLPLPVGWEEVAANTFAPDAQASTAILVQAFPLNVEAALNALSTNLDLDEGQAAERVEGAAFNWQIYTGSVQGSAVALALADKDGQSILVLLISTESEIPFLSGNLLRPILEEMTPLE